jgi:hypothetical protein
MLGEEREDCPWTRWHHTTGPLLAYLADCGGDCSAVADTTTLKWFKIAEAGLEGEGEVVSFNDGWAQRNIATWDGWNVTIPSSLKAGNYMIRHEVIVLGGSYAQLFPNCAHLKVTGDGTSQPSDEYLVKFPGAYKDSGS